MGWLQFKVLRIRSNSCSIDSRRDQKIVGTVIDSPERKRRPQLVAFVGVIEHDV